MCKRFGIIFGLLMILPGLFLIQGCGNSKRESAGEAPLAAISATGNVQAGITGAVVSAGTGTLVVTFTLRDENGAPLDPGEVIEDGGRVRFFVAQIDAAGNYRNYILNASGGGTNDSGGTFATIGDGLYTYTFGTNITSNVMYNATLTHTVAIQVRRTVISITGSPFMQTANPYLNFRPDGNAVTVTREIVAVSNCNECHGKLSGHDGSRIDTALCILCHNPGETGSNGVSIEFKSMIHKIHMGRSLPSNKAGAIYAPNGTDFSKVVYPLRTQDLSLASNVPMDCTNCHKAGTDATGKAYGADVDRWKGTPTMANCQTCHDLTTFDLSSTVTLTSLLTSTTLTAIPHTGSASAVTDADCAGCHVTGQADSADYSGSLSVASVHALPINSNLNNKLVFNITQVEGAVSGSTATVHFTVKDSAGNDYALVGGGAVTGVAKVADAVSIVLGYMTGPDYDNTAAGFIAPDFVQGRTKTVSSATSATKVGIDPSQFKIGNEYVVPFNTVAIPNVPGVGTFAIIAKQGITLPDVASTAHRKALSTATTNGFITGVPATLAYYNFDLTTGVQVTDAALIRRVVVTTEKCNVCHTSVFGHGGRSEIKLCVICHAPNLFNANQQGYSGNLKDLVHGIHGAQLTPQGGLFNGHPNSPVLYPNDPRNCAACHVDSTYQLPLTANVNGSLKTGATSTSLNGTRVLPVKAACVACHENLDASTHADSKVVSGVETCATCHGPGLLTSVNAVHLPVR